MAKTKKYKKTRSLLLCMSECVNYFYENEDKFDTRELYDFCEGGYLDIMRKYFPCNSNDKTLCLGNALGNIFSSLTNLMHDFYCFDIAYEDLQKANKI